MGSDSDVNGEQWVWPSSSFLSEAAVSIGKGIVSDQTETRADR
jgi:hypothetical protein